MPPIDTVLSLVSLLVVDFVEVVWDTSKINNEIKYNFIDFRFPNKFISQELNPAGTLVIFTFSKNFKTIFFGGGPPKSILKVS